jgi:leucyl aminopeptidase
MNFSTKLHYTPLGTATYPVLVAPAFEDEPMPKQLGEIDKAWRGALSRVYSSDVIAKEGEFLIVPSPVGKGIERIAFIGMGPREDATHETVRRAAGSAAKALKKREITRIVFLTETFIPPNESLESTAYSLIEGARLGAYVFDRFKTEKEKSDLLSAELHLPPAGKGRGGITDLDRIVTLTTSTIMARDWDNTPSNFATPSNVARLALDVSREADLTCKVLDRKECENLGMGAFLGVASGSSEPPKFIVLDYRSRKFSKTICFVGKALTFDSGGICIKPAPGMEEMKADKSGGIAVIATMRAVGILKPDGVRVVGIIPATENMPSGSAIKPGDLVRTQSGKSIEVINTDAEGRLVLVDGMEYAIKEYDPDVVIDVATLTGACLIALGFDLAGMWTDRENLAATMLEASRKTGEKVWRMPLVKAYKEHLKSDVADSKNVGIKEGGAITAALFLQQFVGDTPWMHLDIAGPAYSREAGPYIPKGATGFGPRLLYAFIEEWITAQR